MTDYPIKINKFKNSSSVLNNLKFDITKLHKIDEHLYSFCIYHPSAKYCVFSSSWTTQNNGVPYHVIEVLDTCGKDDDDVTAEDFENGNVKEGSIKIKYYKPVDEIRFHFVPLKWETMVFILVDYENCNDLWWREE